MSAVSEPNDAAPESAQSPLGLWEAFSGKAVFAGLLASLAGFASSFAVVVQGLKGVGASPAEAASGLMAVGFFMGLLTVILSLQSRLPIKIAWSTPGAAFLATSGVPEGGFTEAVGAFLVCAALIVVAGLWRPFGRAVAAIPAPLANAMLAGVLFGLCLAPVQAVAEMPVYGLMIVLTWVGVGYFNRLAAVPAAVLVTLGIVVWIVMQGGPGGEALAAASVFPRPVIVIPEFALASVIGIAIPLFIITMASQNIPGMAVLHANGYRPAPGPIFAMSGLFSALSAPFGGHAVNLAAITAAMVASEEGHPDPRRRYWAAVVSGGANIVVALFSGLVILFVTAAPPILIQAVAGLALIGAFAGAAHNALSDAEARVPAAITFLASASGITILGIGGAFWGLLAGGVLYLLMRAKS
ncbi:MAG: benzoate/H(+) symporter BenE family transporter [Pseudomonadota bacterium]